MPSPLPSSPPVRRGALFLGDAVAVHDNVCGRSDPAVSEETRPLEFFEVVFPRSGVWLRHRGREVWSVDAGSAHLFARGESHRVSHPAGCGDRNTGLVLDEGTVEELAPRVVERGTFARAAVAVDERTYAEHCALVELARRGGEELEVEERALALAAGVVRRAEGEPARAIGRSRAHRELAHAARVELAARFRERLGLADLAAPLGVSVFHLCRVFKEEFGAPLHAFRRSLRVRAALRELFVPGRTLYDVAEAAGFSDRTQLHRAFRRTLGVSPSALRRRSTGRSS